MSLFKNHEVTDSGIAYYSHGDGDDVALLVHGSFGIAAMWGMFIQPLIDLGYRVVSLDLIGHGKSPGKLADADMATYVQNVRDVVEADGTTPAVLIGHSMSGLVVLMAAVEGVAQQVIAMDPSPSLEVQGVGSTVGIPDEYTVYEAGMPTEQAAALEALPDMTPPMLMAMSGMLGSDSGRARRQRKEGISIPKEILDDLNVLFIGAELGHSVPFGIRPELTRQMAEHYDKPVHIVDGATHPGILMGSEAHVAVERIVEFLSTES